MVLIGVCDKKRIKSRYLEPDFKGFQDVVIPDEMNRRFESREVEQHLN